MTTMEREMGWWEMVALLLPCEVGKEPKWSSKVFQMENLPAFHTGSQNGGHNNKLEIKHENACKQPQIPQEYAKVSNALILAPK